MSSRSNACPTMYFPSFPDAPTMQTLMRSQESRRRVTPDKVAKTRELRLALARDWSAAASACTADKLEHYWASLALLESVLDQHPLVSQLRFELEALATLPPRTP